MNNVNEPIRFGDVVKLQTKSQFVKNATLSSLGFLDVPGKAEAQLLVVPPVADEAKDRFVDAEFIIAPIRGVNHQPNGTPLTYFTPFVLRTSDGKDGSAYSLNNKLVGQRDGVTLQLAAAKGEMYIQAVKEGCKKTTGLHYGEDDICLHVVDSNRVRKTYNHLITHIEKPKSDTPGGIVASGNKGTALTFSFKHVVDAEGQPLTETRKYIKNPQARRSSMDASSPTKMDQLGRADRVDSSEFSDVDALSRSSSIAGLSSNPASPRGAPSANALATPVDAAAVAARLPAKIEEVPETEATVSSSAASSSESTPPVNSSAEAQRKTSAATPVTPPKNAVVDLKTSASAAPSSPVKTASVKTEVAKAEPAKAEKAVSVKGNTPVKDEAAKAEPVKVEAGAVKNGTAVTDATKAADVKAEAPKSDSVKAGISFWSRRESSKSVTAKADPVKETTPVKGEASKAEPAKAEAAKAEPTKAEAVKTGAEPEQVETATAEPLKADTATAEFAKADTAKAQAGKAEPLKKEASGSTSFWSRRESSKSVTAKADPVKGEAGKAGKPDSVKAETAKAEPVKTEAAKTASVKAETATPQPVKAEAAKAESVKAASVELAKAETSKTGSVKAEQLKVDTATTEPVKADAAKARTAKSDPLKTTQDQHATKTAAAPPAAATAAAKSAPGEPKTVLADASTFPPTPAINGPAPAPVVMSPKASASPKTTPKAGATPTSTPASPKMMKEEEVAKLKAEAEVENLEPACGAKCSVM